MFYIFFLLFVFIFVNSFSKFVGLYLFSHLPFSRFCYLSRAGGGCMMIKTFPFFDHPRRAYIFLSISFPFYLSICHVFVYLIQFSKQNRHNCILFLENFCVYAFSFHVIIIFYSIQAYVIVYFPLFFSFRLLFEVE